MAIASPARVLLGTLSTLGALAAAASNDTDGQKWPAAGIASPAPYNVVGEYAVPPNATGIWSIPGVDFSRPWDGDNSLVDGWDLLFTVHGGWLDEENKTDPVISNPSQVWLRMPEDSFEDDKFDPNWSVCFYMEYSAFDTADDYEALQDDDGTCGAVLPQSCVDELLAQADGDHGCEQSLRCGDVEFLSLLSPPGGNDKADELGNATKSDGGSALRLTGALFPYANPDDPEAVDLAYDEALTEVVPVVVSYKYRGDERNEALSAFRCVRADKVAEGSREPRGFGGRRSAAATAVPSVWAAMAVGLAVVLMV